MSQRSIRFDDETEARVEERARAEGRKFAAWVKRAVDKALLEAPALPESPRPKKRVTHSQRTPPRPPQPVRARPLVEDVPESDEPKTRPGLPVWTGSILEGRVTEKVDAGGPLEVETAPGCAECGGDISVHPEFGRYCTGCGARVR